MNSIIITKTYKEPPFCEKEILRYAGCKSFDDELLQPLCACIDEVRDKLSYKVCYRELPVSISGKTIDFGCLNVQSQNLAKNLQGCKTVIIFAATLGVELDRFIAKYGRISPSKALLLQAIGAERIEALCDMFCEDMAKEKHMVLKPRFSPGYGDVPLEVQKDIFNLLDCSKRIGISLNDSLLMSPSKSVTAFVGLKEFPNFTETVNLKEAAGRADKINKCAVCRKTDCEYRGVV